MDKHELVLKEFIKIESGHAIGYDAWMKENNCTPMEVCGILSNNLGVTVGFRTIAFEKYLFFVKRFSIDSTFAISREISRSRVIRYCNNDLQESVYYLHWATIYAFYEAIKKYHRSDCVPTNEYIMTFPLDRQIFVSSRIETEHEMFAEVKRLCNLCFQNQRNKNDGSYFIPFILEHDVNTIALQVSLVFNETDAQLLLSRMTNIL